MGFTGGSGVQSEHKQKSSNLRTFVNVLKSYCGGGIITIPYAFLQGGVAVSLMGYVLVGVVAVHCMLLLVKCKRYIDDMPNRPPVITYTHIGYVSLGSIGKFAVDVTLLTSQFGFCVAYFLYIGKNLHLLYGHIGIVAWMFIFLAPLILMCWIRNLKMLAPFSALSIFLYLCGFGLIIYYGARSKTFIKNDVQIWPKKIMEVPAFFALALYGFEGIGLVLPVEAAAKSKKGFITVFLLGVSIVVFLYCGFGVFGYISFGKDTLPVSIENVPDNIWRKLATGGNVIAAVLTYPLMMWPVIERVEVMLIKNNKNKSKDVKTEEEVEGFIQSANATKTIEDSSINSYKDYSKVDEVKCCSMSWWWIESRKNLIRAVLVACSLAVALVIPSFELCTQLVGSVFSPMLAFILPCAIHISLFSGKNKMSFNFFKDVLIIVFGIVSSLLCTFVTIEQLVEKIRDHSIHFVF